MEVNVKQIVTATALNTLGSKCETFKNFCAHTHTQKYTQFSQMLFLIKQIVYYLMKYAKCNKTNASMFILEILFQSSLSLPKRGLRTKNSAGLRCNQTLVPVHEC